MSSERVRVLVMRHGTFYTPLIASIAGGFLADLGIESAYAVRRPGDDPWKMLEDGEVDVIQSAVSSSWSRREKGIPSAPRHFAAINRRDGFWISERGMGGLSITAVASAHDAGPFDWKRLEGRALLADHGPQPIAMLRFAAESQGVDWGRVEVVDLGTPDQMMAAFREGTGDFIHLQGPAPQQLARDGIGHVAGSVGAILPELAFSSLCAMPRFLETDTASRFVAGFREGLRWSIEGPAGKIAAMIAPFFKGSNLGVLSSSVAAYKGLGCWNVDPAIRPEHYEEALRVFRKCGGITQEHPYEDVVQPVGD